MLVLFFKMVYLDDDLDEWLYNHVPRQSGLDLNVLVFVI